MLKKLTHHKDDCNRTKFQERCAHVLCRELCIPLCDGGGVDLYFTNRFMIFG